MTKRINYSGGTFKKTGGVIYGSKNSQGEEDEALKNTANGNGDTVFAYPGKKRNSTAGSGVDFDSGTAGGWEE